MAVMPQGVEHQDVFTTRGDLVRGSDGRDAARR